MAGDATKTSPVARFSWGGLLHRDLALLAPLLAVAGCSPPPPSVSPQPPPSSSPRVALPPEVQPVPDEGGASAGVGALKEVAERGEEAFGYNFVYQGVPSGKGLFSFYDFEREGLYDGAPGCSIKTSYPEVCSAFSFAPWQGEPTWPGGWVPSRYGEQLGADGKMFSSPARWQRFSPGKEGVYACREVNVWSQEPEPLVVDFLRSDGRVETFLKDTSGRFSDAEIVEVSGGHLGIFRSAPVAAEGRMYKSVGSLVAAPVVASGKEHKIGAVQELKIGDVWFGGRAADARDARGMHKRASYGPIRGVALLDAKGKQSGEVALAWVEVFPPPGHEDAEEKKQKGEKKRRKGTAKDQCGRPSTTEFYDRLTRRRPFQGDGCGGRVSRFLSSSDVKKVLHITRLSADGKQKDDRAFELSSTYDAEKTPLAAVARPGGGLSINEMNFDGQMHRSKDTPPEHSPFGTPTEAGATPRVYPTIAPPQLSGSPPQRLLGAAFDPRSGEALVMYGEAVPQGYQSTNPMDMVAARRVSALGEPLGKAVEMPELRELTSPQLLGRGKDGWLVLSESPLAFRVVGGVHDGATHPLPEPKCSEPHCYTSLKALLPAPAGRLDLLFTFGSERSNLMQIRVDGGTLLSEAPTSLGQLDLGRLAIDNQGAFRDEEGKPRFWYVDEEGNPVLGGSSPREEDGGKKKEAQRELHQVWGDLVIVTRTKQETRATWLKAGKTATLDLKQDDASEGEVLRIRGEAGNGPVLSGGKWILPSTPGPAVEAPRELREALKLCPVHLPTGPRRLLLVCSEAPDDQRPMVRVGTRVARY